MFWCDVAGSPAAGKSTICDPLWPADAIAPVDIAMPESWHDFANEVTRLLGLVRDHPTFVAAVRMNRRSMRKMAVVATMESDKPYIQTGFIQRGLGFGWRLVDMGKPVEELVHFFRLMPVSLGAVFLDVDEKVLAERNKARESVKETAHENRAFMGPLMRPAIAFAKEVLHARGVPILELDTSGDIDAARSRLVGFADAETKRNGVADIPALHPRYAQSCNVASLGFGGKVPAVSPVVWW